MQELILPLLQATDFRMEVQPVFGAFHILTAAVLVLAAAAAARHFRNRSERFRIRLLAVCGWFLILTEVYKQAFLYYIVNNGQYDYWFLPFQLCSVPMYLTVLLPWLRGRAREAVLTFLATYTFVSAVATFLYPADLLRPYLLLTLHGFLWHGILLFISLTVTLSGMADLTARAFARATVLFVLLCALAVILNVIAEPFAVSAAAQGAPHAHPNMFYLNPYHYSTQPLIGGVQQRLGIPAGLIVYIAAIIGLSGMVCFAFRRNSAK
ncbi:MAG: YwaF family protein [Mogibacterium sp.]|nr:YwaF family protein [Mogibacterium sp.]